MRQTISKPVSFDTAADLWIDGKAIFSKDEKTSKSALDRVGQSNTNSNAPAIKSQNGNSIFIPRTNRSLSNQEVTTAPLLRVVPATKPSKRIRRKTTTEPISWTKAMMLLAAMRDKDPVHDNIRLMLACGFYLGLRIGDILQLQYRDLMGEELIIHEQKTGKQRRIYLNEGFREIVYQVISNLNYVPVGYIFTYKRKGASQLPISVTAANKRIRKIFDQYEIECANPSSHCLRKTFGKHVYKMMGKTDEALLILNEIFNHQGNLHITKKYIGTIDEQVQDVYRNL